MSNPEERQASTPGSTPSGARATGATATSRSAGYDQGTAYEQGTGGYRQAEPAGQEYYPPAGRHEGGGHRGAIVTFTAVAGALMILGGLWGVTVGIVGLSSSHYYFTSPATGYTYRWSVHGWGWAELIFGIVVFAAGACVFLGMAWARYLGVALAVISAVGNFMLLPFMPLWAIFIIAIDAFIIWALLAPRREPGQI